MRKHRVSSIESVQRHARDAKHGSITPGSAARPLVYFQQGLAAAHISATFSDCSTNMRERLGRTLCLVGRACFMSEPRTTTNRVTDRIWRWPERARKKATLSLPEAHALMRRRKLEFRRSGETPENRSLCSIADQSRRSLYPGERRDALHKFLDRLIIL